MLQLIAQSYCLTYRSAVGCKVDPDAYKLTETAAEMWTSSPTSADQTRLKSSKCCNSRWQLLKIT